MREDSIRPLVHMNKPNLSIMSDLMKNQEFIDIMNDQVNNKEVQDEEE